MLRLAGRIQSDLAFARRFLFSDIESDIENNTNILKDLVTETSTKERTGPKFWNLYKAMPTNIDPSLTSVVLFPGQGSQYVGMGKKIADNPRAKQLFDNASEYLNRNILKLCLEGPEDKLCQTIHCQPCIYTASLAAMEVLREENPELIENCVATAGNSLGEISALVFAGVLTFEQGLHFVRIRAEHMQRACNERPGGLLTVFISPKTNLSKALAAAKLYCKDKFAIEKPVCEISTYLFSECKVIGGNIEALEFLETFAKDFHIKATKRLPVSGAFHTALMASAVPQCRHALTRIGPIRPPQVHVLSNVTGTVHTSESAIKRLLAEQLCRPVLWEQTLMRLYMRPADVAIPRTVEVGPGTQIGKTVRRVNTRALTHYTAVPV